jgi:mannose/fructose-specific phosphotransferase system component IIA
MLTGVIVVTHGDAGAAMIAAAEQKVGHISSIAAVGVRLEDTATDVKRRLDEAVDGLHVKEVVFLVDLGGSTPFNMCCRSCAGHSVVVSGVNLPMLFKLSTVDRESGARQLAEELVKTGTKSIGLREG